MGLGVGPGWARLKVDVPPGPPRDGHADGTPTVFRMPALGGGRLREGPGEPSLVPHSGPTRLLLGFSNKGVPLPFKGLGARPGDCSQVDDFDQI